MLWIGIPRNHTVKRPGARRPPWTAGRSRREAGRLLLLEVAGGDERELGGIEVAPERGVDLRRRERENLRLEVDVPGEGALHEEIRAQAVGERARSCVRAMRRCSSSACLPALTSSALKPSRAARASSSRIACSTRRRFCGAQMAPMRKLPASSKALALKLLNVL